MNVGLHPGVPNNVVGTTSHASKGDDTRQPTVRSMASSSLFGRLIENYFSRAPLSGFGSEAQRDAMRSLHIVS